jgi:hypothetical protein
MLHDRQLRRNEDLLAKLIEIQREMAEGTFADPRRRSRAKAKAVAEPSAGDELPAAKPAGRHRRVLLTARPEGLQRLQPGQLITGDVMKEICEHAEKSDFGAESINQIVSMFNC